MRNKRKITINWILLISWMCVIFIMSNQPAQISDSQSKGVIELFSSMGINIDGVFGQLANFVVRKCAHFIEYMILSLLTVNVLNLYVNAKKVFILTITVVFIYACTDEIHQLFIVGREGAVRDVIIDTLGGITLIMIKLLKDSLIKGGQVEKDKR